MILVRGQPNQLKCWRWRLQNRSRRVTFRCFSTTFSWVTNQPGEGRSSTSRMLVVFDKKEDRDTFVAKVKFPPNVTWCYGKLDCL